MKMRRELLNKHHVVQTIRKIAVVNHLQAWTAQRRRNFLFREDALLPLSMDRYSWPLCEKGRDGVSVIITEVHSSWESTDEEVSALENAEFLGFDVGNPGEISTLSNCGFSFASERVLAQRDEWARKLNCFHLFDFLEDAEAFCRFSDAEWVREHAPAQVFGIWLPRY